MIETNPADEFADLFAPEANQDMQPAEDSACQLRR